MTTFNPWPPPAFTYSAVPLRPPPFPNVWQAVVLTAILLGAQFATGLLLFGILHLLLGPSAQSASLDLLGLANILSFLATLVVGILWGRLPWREAVPLRGIPVALLPPMVLTVLGLSVLLSGLSNVVLLLLPPPDFARVFFQELLGNDGPSWNSVILLTVIAPFTEEPIFRGLLLNGLLLRLRPWMAIGLTALLFAAVHLNPWQFGPALALGLLFGWWFQRTRSLWPGIIGHAVNNALPCLVSLIPGSAIPGYSGSTPDQIEFQPLWFDMAGLVVFVLGLAWTRHVFRKTPRPPPALPVPPVSLPPIARPVPSPEQGSPPL